MYDLIPITEDEFEIELWEDDQPDPFNPDPEYVTDDDNVPFGAGVETDV